MLRLSLKQKVTNVEILSRVKKDIELLNAIKEKKLTYFGHIMCCGGENRGKRTAGRK